MGRLDGRVAIVTGAASGIGEACAVRLAADGAAVVLTDLSEHVTEVAAAIGGKVLAIVGDSTDAGHVAHVVAEAERAFGTVDGLVCAAGIAPHTDLLALAEAELARVLAVNVISPFLFGQAVAKALVAAGKPGAIVNITSTSARLAGPNQLSYCTSKAALDGMTRAMAIELAPSGIRVNAVGPGPTATGMMTGAMGSKEVVDRILSRTPIGRVAEPSEQASVVAFLLSDDASFVTGETIYVDGGRLALQYTMPPKA